MNLELLFNGFLDKVTNLGFKIAFALLIFVIGCQLIRILRKIIKRFMERVKCDKGVIQFTDAFVKAALLFLLVLSIATHFGLEVTGAATIIGSAGVTIGLALQGSLSNFVGGILLLLLKPFKVGDFIIEDTNKNEGTVKEISLFYTKLITVDGRIVILPNGTLANTSMTNVTDQEYRRLDLCVSIAYDANLTKAKEILWSILKEDIRIDHSKEERVFVDNLAESAVVLGVRCYVKQDEYWNLKWDLLEKIKLKLDEGEVEIPYNRLDVKLYQ